jgi:hypothetical protein
MSQDNPTYEELEKIAANVNVDEVLAKLPKEILIAKVKATGQLIGKLGRQYNIPPIQLMAKLIELESDILLKDHHTVH